MIPFQQMPNFPFSIPHPVEGVVGKRGLEDVTGGEERGKSLLQIKLNSLPMVHFECPRLRNSRVSSYFSLLYPPAKCSSSRHGLIKNINRIWNTE